MAKFSYRREEDLELVLCKRSLLSYPRHNHVSVAALGFVLEGSLELVTEEGSRLCRAGECFALPPYAAHCLNAQSPYTLLSLCAGRDVLERYEERAGDVSRFLADALRAPELETRMLEALGALARRVPSRAGESAVRLLRDRLEAEPERRCSLEELAASSYVSKYHLIRRFKREVGLTPHQFQMQNRVRKAQRLLRDSAPTAEAALAAGFCDQSHLSRYFKQIVGLTPGQYRRCWNTEVPLL